MLNTSAKIIWLASYPKSGNTWTRSFLTALIKTTKLDINKLDYGNYISTRDFADEMLGLNSSDLPEHDYLQYRASMFNKWANKSKESMIPCKIHDACNRGSHILCPPEVSRGVVYIMRNPFDIVASLANHKTIDISESAKLLCDSKYTMAGKKNGLTSQLSQFIGSWANHVKSWADVHKNNMLLVKYEDLIKNPLAEFSKIVAYMDLNYSMDQISAAVDKSSMSNLQKLEQQTKFNEAPKMRIFFREGKAGNWRNEITIDQAKKIVDSNYDMLLKHSYINANGDILV